MANTPKLQSLADLSQAMDTAFQLHIDRHQAQFGPDNMIHHWEVLGRTLNDLGKADSALTIAKNIAKKVGGPKALPVVTELDKKQFVGFLPANRP